MDRADLPLIVLADAPDALLEVCGVSLLERLLRIAQRLGFTRARVISSTPEEIREALALPSWSRAGLSVVVSARPAGPVTIEAIAPYVPTQGHALIVPGAVYCDARLLRALADHHTESVLIDSAPPASVRSWLDPSPDLPNGWMCGPCRISASFLRSIAPSAILPEELRRAVTAGTIATIDAASEPTYIISMRRDLRPVCLPAPMDRRKDIERIILVSAQKGSLDLPAYVHAPIETFIVSHLCRTTITPNQITLTGFAIGLLATLSFFTGHFAVGAALALIFGVVDGLDGKQSRVKIENTPRGEWEHQLDFAIEYSWWITLAFAFHRTGQLPNAFYFLAFFVASDLIDREFKRQARAITGRLLDDVSAFDQKFRLFSSRRNINTWILTIGLLLGQGAHAYQAIAIWAGCSAAVHVARSISIRLARRLSPAA
jgi:hypothetical protein